MNSGGVRRSSIVAMGDPTLAWAWGAGCTCAELIFRHSSCPAHSARISCTAAKPTARAPNWPRAAARPRSVSGVFKARLFDGNFKCAGHLQWVELNAASRQRRRQSLRTCEELVSQPRKMKPVLPWG